MGEKAICDDEASDALVIPVVGFTQARIGNWRACIDFFPLIFCKQRRRVPFFELFSTSEIH